MQADPGESESCLVRAGCGTVARPPQRRRSRPATCRSLMGKAVLPAYTDPGDFPIERRDMTSMVISRRHILALMAGAALAPGTVVAAGRQPLYISANTSAPGGSEARRHGVSLLDTDGMIVAQFDLPSRGHAAAVDPARRVAVLFARRPGTFAAVIDLSRQKLLRLIESQPDRHFYGHGCFSADGRFLFATENDFDGERGALGIYDAEQGFARVGELPSHGIGPHEAILMPDGETLAAANGGVLTHPSAPRMKLNVADMQPSLTLIRIRDGALLAEYKPDPSLHQSSIRHVAANAAGDIAFVMQWEGDEREQPPLVGLLRRQAVSFHAAPGTVQGAMRNYCGSVTYAANGKSFLVSSPRGDVLTEWRADGSFLRAHAFPDSCATSEMGADGFFVTNGGGEIGRVSPRTSKVAEVASYPELKWHNHIRRIG